MFQTDQCNVANDATDCRYQHFARERRIVDQVLEPTPEIVEKVWRDGDEFVVGARDARELPRDVEQTVHGATVGRLLELVATLAQRKLQRVVLELLGVELHVQSFDVGVQRLVACGQR